MEGSVGIPDAALSSAVEFLPSFSNDGAEPSYAQVAARSNQTQHQAKESGESKGQPPAYQESQSNSTQQLPAPNEAGLGKTHESREESHAKASKPRTSRGGGHRRGETEGDAAAEETGTRRGELKRFTLWETKTVSSKGKRRVRISSR